MTNCTYLYIVLQIVFICVPAGEMQQEHPTLKNFLASLLFKFKFKWVVIKIKSNFKINLMDGVIHVY